MVLGRSATMATKAKSRATRTKVRKAAFRVMWDDARRRYIALDDTGVLLGLSDVKGLAMGIARTAAMNAARERRALVSVYVEDDQGNVKRHWSFAPLGRGHN